MASCLSASSCSPLRLITINLLCSPSGTLSRGGYSFSHGDLGSGPDRVTNARKSIVMTIKLAKIVKACPSAAASSVFGAVVLRY